MSHTPGSYCIHDGESIYATDRPVGSDVCEGEIHRYRIARFDLVGERLYRGEDFEDGPYDVRFPETEGNVRLFAAAPDLLAACRMVLAVLDADLRKYPALPPEHEELWFVCRSAIEKTLEPVG